MLKSNSFFVLTISTIVFRFILEWSYVKFVATQFAYVGYTVDPDIAGYFLSWLFYLSGLFFVKVRVRKPSDFFMVMGLYGVMCPLSVYFGLDAKLSVYPLVLTWSVLWVIYFICNAPVVLLKRIPSIKQGTAILCCISVLLIVYLVFWYQVVGVTFNFNLDKVYEYRRANAELADFGILVYVNSWIYQIISVSLFVLALYYKRYFLSVFMFMVQVYFFGATAHKVILLYPLLALGIWYYYKKNSSSAVIPFGLSIVIVISLMSYYLVDDIHLSSLFSRRTFFVPARLTYDYFEFFSNNPNIFWSNSVLSMFLEYPYDLPVGEVIGLYLGEQGLNANNGFVSMGYAHAQEWGVYIYAVIAGGIMKVLDDITAETVPLWVGLSLTIVPIQSFLFSTDLFTALLTHGLIISLIVIFLIRKRHTSFAEMR